MATSSDDTGAGGSAAGGGGGRLSSSSTPSKPRKERTSLCSYCGMTFNKKEHLQRHERTHTLDRPYHCDAPGCGKAFARRDTLTRHTRLHQRDDVGGSLKISLANALGEDDELSETYTTPAGSKQVSPATSGSTAPGPASSSSAALLNVKGKKATHSRTGSIASQKSSRRGSGSRGPPSHPGSKKNTPEYKTPAEDAHHKVTPTAAIRNNRPRRAAAAALYDENALMDEDTPSEHDEMQDDSGNDQDFMIMPSDIKPDVHQVSQPTLVTSIGQPTDAIKPLLPSLHTSSYLTRTLDAQQNQGIPHVKPAHATPIAATTLAGGHQPIYNFSSWDHANAFAAGQPNNERLTVHGNEGNPALLGYSSSANSSGSSSGSTYNSSQMGSGGSASLASPYSFNGSNPQATPGSALGLDLGLPPSPAAPAMPTPQEVQHFQGFNFPGTNNSNNTNEGSAASDPQSQPYRIHGYPPGQPQQQQQRQQQHQQGGFEIFPSFQGPNSSQHHHQQQQRHRSTSGFAGAAAFPVPATASAAGPDGNTTVPPNGTRGSQGYSNQSTSTAAQSFLARGASGSYSPQLSQCNPSSSVSLMSTSAPPTQSAFPANVGAFGNNNVAGNNLNRKRASTFVPSFWAHMSVQHQDLGSGPMHSQQNMFSHLHHRAATTNSFSTAADDFEILSNQSDTSSPMSAPSMLSTSPTFTTSMNLYGMTSPASDMSNLPSLSSSFSSAFSGDFLNAADGNMLVSTGAGGRTDEECAGPPPFKHRNSFMEQLPSLDPANMTVRPNPTELNAAMLKAADAHTDQFINWPERDDASPYAFPGLSPENAFSAPSVMTSNSPSSASYLDLSDFDNTQTSLFGDKTFTIPLEIAQQTSARAGNCGTASSAFGDGIDGIGRLSPVSSLEDWLLKQTSGNEYVY